MSFWKAFWILWSDQQNKGLMKTDFTGATLTRNFFMRFRAGLKINLRQYIKSDFDLFWGPDVLWRSNSDTESQPQPPPQKQFSEPLELGWIRGWNLTSKFIVPQFWLLCKINNKNSIRRTCSKDVTVWYRRLTEVWVGLTEPLGQKSISFNNLL